MCKIGTSAKINQNLSNSSDSEITMQRTSQNVRTDSAGFRVQQSPVTTEEKAGKRHWDTEISHHKVALSSGIRMHFAAAGPNAHSSRSKGVIVFVHGFPELWISWRQQLLALATEGFTAIAPDMRGYGETDVPKEVEDYSMEHRVNDLLALLDYLNVEKAIFVGHDWGGGVVWLMPMVHPERVKAVIVLNTPLPLDSPIDEEHPPSVVLRSQSSSERGHLEYSHYYCEYPDQANAEFNANPFKTMSAFFRNAQDIDSVRLGMRTRYVLNKKKGTNEPIGVLGRCPENLPLDPLWTKEQVKEYSDAFEKTGFNGALNWYRTRDIDFYWRRKLQQQNKYFTQINVPCLMITATYDSWSQFVCTPEVKQEMNRRIHNLTFRNLDCGHWTQHEKPEELNKLLKVWLDQNVVSNSESIQPKL